MFPTLLLGDRSIDKGVFLGNSHGSYPGTHNIKHYKDHVSNNGEREKQTMKLSFDLHIYVHSLFLSLSFSHPHSSLSP